MVLELSVRVSKKSVLKGNNSPWHSDSALDRNIDPGEDSYVKKVISSNEGINFNKDMAEAGEMFDVNGIEDFYDKNAMVTYEVNGHEIPVHLKPKYTPQTKSLFPEYNKDAPATGATTRGKTSNTENISSQRQNEQSTTISASSQTDLNALQAQNKLGAKTDLNSDLKSDAKNALKLLAIQNFLQLHKNQYGENHGDVNSPERKVELLHASQEKENKEILNNSYGNIKLPWKFSDSNILKGNSDDRNSKPINEQHQYANSKDINDNLVPSVESNEHTPLENDKNDNHQRISNFEKMQGNAIFNTQLDSMPSVENEQIDRHNGFLKTVEHENNLTPTKEVLNSMSDSSNMVTPPTSQVSSSTVNNPKETATIDETETGDKNKAKVRILSLLGELTEKLRGVEAVVSNQRAKHKEDNSDIAKLQNSKTLDSSVIPESAEEQLRQSFDESSPDSSYKQLVSKFKQKPFAPNTEGTKHEMADKVLTDVLAAHQSSNVGFVRDNAPDSRANVLPKTSSIQETSNGIRYHDFPHTGLHESLSHDNLDMNYNALSGTSPRDTSELEPHHSESDPSSLDVDKLTDHSQGISDVNEVNTDLISAHHLTPQEAAQSQGMNHESTLKELYPPKNERLDILEEQKMKASDSKSNEDTSNDSINNLSSSLRKTADSFHVTGNGEDKENEKLLPDKIDKFKEQGKPFVMNTASIDYEPNDGSEKENTEGDIREANGDQDFDKGTDNTKYDTRSYHKSNGNDDSKIANYEKVERNTQKKQANAYGNDYKDEEQHGVLENTKSDRKGNEYEGDDIARSSKGHNTEHSDNYDKNGENEEKIQSWHKKENQHSAIEFNSKDTSFNKFEANKNIDDPSATQQKDESNLEHDFSGKEEEREKHAKKLKSEAKIKSEDSIDEETLRHGENSREESNRLKDDENPKQEDDSTEENNMYKDNEKLKHEDDSREGNNRSKDNEKLKHGYTVKYKPKSSREENSIIKENSKEEENSKHEEGLKHQKSSKKDEDSKQEDKKKNDAKTGDDAKEANDAKLENSSKHGESIEIADKEKAKKKIAESLESLASADDNEPIGVDRERTFTPKARYSDDIEYPDYNEVKDAALFETNFLRNKYHAKKMSWSDRLSDKAQQLAEKVAKSGVADNKIEVYRHPGENVALVRSNAPNVGKEAVDMWAKEAKAYDFKSPLVTKKNSDFVQLAWKANNEFGMGVAKSKNGNGWVVTAFYDTPYVDRFQDLRSNLQPDAPIEDPYGDIAG